MDDLLDRLSDASLKVIKNINPAFENLDEIDSFYIIEELYSSSHHLSGLIDKIDEGVDFKHINVRFDDWIINSFYEASITSSNIVDLEHLFFGLLILIDAEKYYISKKNFIPQISNETKLLSAPFLDDFTMSQDDKNVIIGREKEVIKILVNLAINKEKPILILGDEGVGKLAIMKEVARRITKNDVPDELKDANIIRINVSKLLNSLPIDPKYPPNDYISRIITSNIVKPDSDKRLIIFFDDIRIGANLFVGFTLSNPNNNVSIIATAQNDIDDKIWESAITKNWNIVAIEEMESDATKTVVEKYVNERASEFKIHVTEGVVKKIIDLHRMNLIQGAMPGAGINAVDELLQYKKLLSSTSEIKSRGRPKTVSLTSTDVEEYYDYKKPNYLTNNRAKKSNIKKLKNLEKHLKGNIIGQDHAIKTLTQALIVSNLNLHRENQPKGIFLLLGPTGVGKTETAKALASYFYGNNEANIPNNFIRIDMTEYSEKHSVSKLFGAPPGYVGYDDYISLVDYVSEYPESVILFDEIDKAHPEVLTSLLHIMDEGYVRNNLGTLINFTGTTIIMTSNYGVEAIKRNSLGYGNEEKSSINENWKKDILQKIKKQLKPEFINRIDELIIYDILDAAHIELILDHLLKPIISKLKSNGITLVVTNQTKAKIIKESNYIEYGARELKRNVRRIIMNKVSDHIMRSNIMKNIKI